MSQPRGSQLELTGPAAPAGEPPSSPLDAIPVDVVVPRAIVDVYEAFNHAKSIVQDVDPDPWMDVNADYFLPPYGTNDQVDVEEDGRFHMYHEDAKSYKAKKNGAIIKQVFKLDEVKLISELGVMLWQDCDVRQPPNVIEEV